MSEDHLSNVEHSETAEELKAQTPVPNEIPSGNVVTRLERLEAVVADLSHSAGMAELATRLTKAEQTLATMPSAETFVEHSNVLRALYSVASQFWRKLPPLPPAPTLPADASKL